MQRSLPPVHALPSQSIATINKTRQVKSPPCLSYPTPPKKQNGVNRFDLTQRTASVNLLARYYCIRNAYSPLLLIPTTTSSPIFLASKYPLPSPPPTSLSISPLLRDGNLGAFCAVTVVRIVLRRQQTASEVSLKPLPGRQVRIYDPKPAAVDPNLFPDAEISGGVDVSRGRGSTAAAVLSPSPTCSRFEGQ